MRLHWVGTLYDDNDDDDNRKIVRFERNLWPVPKSPIAFTYYYLLLVIVDTTAAPVLYIVGQ